MRAGFVVIAALYCAPILVMLGYAMARSSARSVAALGLTAALVALVVGAATRTWRQFYLLQWPFWAAGAAFATYAVVFHMPPGSTLARILAGTSWEELRGFLSVSKWRWGFAALAVAAVGFLAGAWRLPDFPMRGSGTSRVRLAVVLCLLATTAYVAVDAAAAIDGIALDPTVGAVMFLAGDLPRARTELRGGSIHKIPYGAQRLTREEVHILVVGESVRRDSWSVYGYDRATTPHLDALKATGEAVFLDQAVADANLTEWSVPILLTGLSPVGFDMGKITGNLLDLAREAGYSTAWLVNQDIGISASIGIQADRLDYPPDFQMNINGRHSLDDVLLPSFGREIKRERGARFIGIHMMGSHWEYYRRYPAAFRRFGAHDDSSPLSMVSVLVDDRRSQSAVVDAYDNVTLYTDWFLSELIGQARTLDVPVTLTFFPDHGEDLQRFDGEAGHGQPKYTPHAFDIPAFVWMNDAYRRAHPELAAAVRRNASREIRTHDVFYTLADLMGIRWPGYRPERSFASDRFLPDTTMEHVAGGVLVRRE